MKKSLVTGLAILTLLPQVVAAAAVNMTYNGSPIYADVPPIIRNDRTFVPLRFLSETLGYKVGWDNATRTATVSGKSEIRLTIGKTTALVNGEEKSLDVAPFIEKERTMVPIRFVAENMEGNIEWDEQTKTVKMTGPELPKAKSITVTVEGQKILEIANPKMVGDTPMIPVGQFLKHIDVKEFAKHVKGLHVSTVPHELAWFIYAPEGKDGPAENSPEKFIFSFEPGYGHEIAYYPEFRIFKYAHEFHTPFFRSQTEPLVENKELYVDPYLFAYLFRLRLVEDGPHYRYKNAWGDGAIVPNQNLYPKAVAKTWEPMPTFTYEQVNQLSWKHVLRVAKKQLQ